MQESDEDSAARTVDQAVELLKRRPVTKHEAMIDWQRELRRSIDEIIALRLREPFNEKLMSMPREMLDEKRALCRWANAELRRCGLTIACPRTGESALLVAGPGHEPAVGCFQLELNRAGRRQREGLADAVRTEIEERGAATRDQRRSLDDAKKAIARRRAKPLTSHTAEGDSGVASVWAGNPGVGCIKGDERSMIIAFIACPKPLPGNENR